MHLMYICCTFILYLYGLIGLTTVWLSSLGEKSFAELPPGGCVTRQDAFMSAELVDSSSPLSVSDFSPTTRWLSPPGGLIGVILDEGKNENIYNLQGKPQENFPSNCCICHLNKNQIYISTYPPLTLLYSSRPTLILFAMLVFPCDWTE